MKENEMEIKQYSSTIHADFESANATEIKKNKRCL